jgi:hypothetical protein
VPRTRRERIGLGLGIAVPSALFVALLAVLTAAQGAMDSAGCGSIDPTEAANYSSVTIQNDTAGTVVVDDCPGAYCKAYNLPARLRPGQHYRDDAACHAAGADMTSWRVSTADGRLLGYIAVDTPRKHDGLVFNVSHASPNRSTPTSPG